MNSATARGVPMSLANMAQTTWQGCIYGPPGCGKTVTAMGSQLHTFAYDVDIGMNSALSWRVSHGLPLESCDVWPVKTIADFDAGTRYLEANIDKYQLIVIDTATELQRIITREVCKGRSSGPDQREWGTIRTLSENLTVKFRYMPAHLVYTCHEVNKFDADYERDVYRPSFDGRFAFEYAKHFSWIARMVAIQVPTGRNKPDGKPETSVIRALNFGPDPFMHFKDRSGAMRNWEEPQLDSLLIRMMQSTMVSQQSTTEGQLAYIQS